jgi:putative endonuclease
MPCFVYILRCADDTLYTGWTTNLAAREKAHNEGRGARYTVGRRPVRVVYAEAHETRSDAQRREAAIKRWPRAKKDALIAPQDQRLAGLDARLARQEALLAGRAAGRLKQRNPHR